MIVRERQLPPTALVPKVQRLPPRADPSREIDLFEATWLLLCEFGREVWRTTVPVFVMFFMFWLLGRALEHFK